MSKLIDRFKPLTWEKLDKLLHCKSDKRYSNIKLYRKFGTEFVLTYVTGYMNRIVEPLDMGGGSHKMQTKKQLCCHEPHPLNMSERSHGVMELDTGEYIIEFYDIEDFYYLPKEGIE